MKILHKKKSDYNSMKNMFGDIDCIVKIIKTIIFTIINKSYKPALDLVLNTKNLNRSKLISKYKKIQIWY